MLSIPAESPAGIKSLERARSGGVKMMTAVARGSRYDEEEEEDVMIGAATVISVKQVDEAADHGASFISCPHMDPEIIERYDDDDDENGFNFFSSSTAQRSCRTIY